jgi:16S rRNA (guanine527-N7)-methyltransferase
VPGLVIALDRPDLAVVLVDRRQKRTDFLHRAVARLDYGDRVTVRCDDVERMAASGAMVFDGVTARGFGPPATTLGLAVRLAGPGAPIVISEPPAGDRWDADLLATLDLDHDRRPGVAVFRRRSVSS